MSKWSTEGANLFNTALKKEGLQPLDSLTVTQREAAALRMRELFRNFDISGRRKSSGFTTGLKTELANEIRKEFNLGKWIPLALLVSDSRHRMIRNNLPQRTEDVAAHSRNSFDINLMWERNKHESDNSLSRIETDINNQSSHFYRSLVEVLSNAIDASNPSLKKIGRFGVGFYQIFQHLRKSSDFITLVTTQTQDTEATQLLFRKGDRGVEVCMVRVPKEEGYPTGTKITIEAGHLDPLKALKFISRSLQWNSDAKIEVNGKGVNTNTLRRFRAKERETIPVVKAQLEVGRFTIEDRGHGMSVDDLLHKLLVPKFSGKKSVRDLTTEHESPSLQWIPGDLATYQKGSTVVLVGGVRVSEFSTQGVNCPKVMLINLPHSTKLTEERDGVYPDFLVQEAYKELIQYVLTLPLHHTAALLNGLLPVVLDFDRKNVFNTQPNFLLNYVRDELLRVYPDVDFLPNSAGSDELGLDHGTFTLLDSTILTTRLCRIKGITPLSSIQGSDAAPNIASTPFTTANTLYSTDKGNKTIFINSELIKNIRGELSYLVPAIISLTKRFLYVEDHTHLQGLPIPEQPSLEEILNRASQRLGYFWGAQIELTNRSKEYPEVTETFLTCVWPYLQTYQQFDGMTLLEDALWAQATGMSEEVALCRLRVIGKNLKLFSESKHFTAEITSSLPELFETWAVKSCTGRATSRGSEIFKTWGPDKELYIGSKFEYYDQPFEEGTQKYKIEQHEYYRKDGATVTISYLASYKQCLSVEIYDRSKGFKERFLPHESCKEDRNSYRRYDHTSYTQEKLNTLGATWIKNATPIPEYISPETVSQFEFTDTRIQRSGRDYCKRYAPLISQVQNRALHDGYRGTIVELATGLMINEHPSQRSESAHISKRLFFKFHPEVESIPLSAEKVALLEHFVNQNPLLNRSQLGRLLQNAQTAAPYSDSLFVDLLPSMIVEDSPFFFPISPETASAFDKIDSPSGEFRSLVITRCFRLARELNIKQEVFAKHLIAFVNLAQKYTIPSSLRDFLCTTYSFRNSCADLLRALESTVPESLGKEALLEHSGMHQIFIRFLLGRDQSLAAQGIKDPERKMHSQYRATARLSELIAWSQTNQRKSDAVGDGKLSAELPFLQNAVTESSLGKNLTIVQNEITHAVEATTDQPYRWAIELISNALDAERSVRPPHSSVSISVRARALKNGECCFTVKDTKGMNLGEVVRFLLIPGQSSKVATTSQIGFFGQGFFTALQFAKKVVVQTRSSTEKEGLQVTITPIRESGLVIDADIQLSKLNTTQIGTAIHWIGTHENPGFWISEVGAAVQSNFRYLDQKDGVIKFNGSRNSAKRKLLTVGESSSIGKIKIWLTDDYFDSVTVKGLPLTNGIEGNYQSLPRTLIRTGSRFSGLQVELPQGVQLTRSRKGIAGGQLEEFDLSKDISRLLCDTFLKQLQRMPAREVANLFPFYELPKNYFTDSECFNLADQESIKRDAERLMKGENIEDVARYDAAGMIARLMSFMPIFTIKRKKYSLEELKTHYAALSGPFTDTHWLFTFKNDGTTSAIREYLYSINVPKQIAKFDVDHPYLGIASIEGPGSNNRVKVLISPAPLNDFLAYCSENNLETMRSYRSDLEALERQSRLVLSAIFDQDTSDDWTILFEGNSQRRYYFSPVRVCHDAKEVVWNAGYLVESDNTRRLFCRIPKNFIHDMDHGCNELLTKLARGPIRSLIPKDSLQAHWTYEDWCFHYWMKVLASGSVDRFRY